MEERISYNSGYSIHLSVRLSIHTYIPPSLPWPLIPSPVQRHTLLSVSPHSLQYFLFLSQTVKCQLPILTHLCFKPLSWILHHWLFQWLQMFLHCSHWMFFSSLNNLSSRDVRASDINKSGITEKKRERALLHKMGSAILVIHNHSPIPHE